MLFVLKDSKTYYFGAGMDMHDNIWVDDYTSRKTCLETMFLQYFTIYGSFDRDIHHRLCLQFEILCSYKHKYH